MNSKKDGYYIPKFLAFKNHNISSLSFYFYNMVKEKLTIKKNIEMLKNSIDNINFYPEEYKQEHILYKELLKELLESLRVKI